MNTLRGHEVVANDKCEITDYAALATKQELLEITDKQLRTGSTELSFGQEVTSRSLSLPNDPEPCVRIIAFKDARTHKLVSVNFLMEYDERDSMYELFLDNTGSENGPQLRLRKVWYQPENQVFGGFSLASEEERPEQQPITENEALDLIQFIGSLV